MTSEAQNVLLSVKCFTAHIVSSWYKAMSVLVYFLFEKLMEGFFFPAGLTDFLHDPTKTLKPSQKITYDIEWDSDPLPKPN